MISICYMVWKWNPEKVLQNDSLVPQKKLKFNDQFDHV